jgi:DnaJ-class molecular chaperone
VSAAFEALGLPDTASASEVRIRWKALAQRLHPDRGGDAQAFMAMKENYETALAVAQSPRTCQACHGLGYTTVARGFNAINMPCRWCGGAGVTKDEL